MDYPGSAQSGALYILELLGVSVMYTGFIKSEEVIRQKDEPK